MKRPRRGKVANPTGPPQAVEVLTRTRLLAAYEGLVVVNRLMSPPRATGGVVSYELYDAPAGCVCDRLEAAQALVTGALAQPGNPDPGAIRSAYDEAVKARAGLAVAPAALSWGNSGPAAEAAGTTWLREIERVLEATLARLRELVAGLGANEPANKSRGQ